MAYGQFKSIQEVAIKFDIEVARKAKFAKQKQLDVLDALFAHVSEKINDDMSFINEITVCERIISPILDIVASAYIELDVWSHVPYNIDEKKGLVGEPDYLIASRTKYGGMSQPSLCIIEAKQEKFDEGWAQALSEMFASSLLDARLCYGVVTTGKTWEFGQLEQAVFTIDPLSLSASTELQRVFDTLNWMFNAVSKNK